MQGHYPPGQYILRIQIDVPSGVPTHKPSVQVVVVSIHLTPRNHYDKKLHEPHKARPKIIANTYTVDHFLVRRTSSADSGRDVATIIDQTLCKLQNL